MRGDSLHLRLPATSANLGPGFDAAGLALSLYLTVDAERASAFSLTASGRDAEVCGNLEESLIVSTYRQVMRDAGKAVSPLALRLANEIPLGMGCGSSAAALLAGVALADHYGALGLGDAGIVAEASRLEGHPDNVAACWYGGFTVSAEVAGRVEAVTFAGDPVWRLLLAMQESSLATRKARALLPETYSKADAVFNVQRVALLTAAFAQERLDLLGAGMADRLHQPFRIQACPLLKDLLPLQSEAGVAGVALSGAGPSVLVVLAADADEDEVRRLILQAAGAGTTVLGLRVAGGVYRG